MHSWAKTFGFAFAGIGYSWRTQRNFRVEVGLGIIAVVTALALKADLVPILLCAMVVLPLEMANTAIEAVVDLASPEFHDLAKIAKDVAAGAVLLASLTSVVIGLIVLAPPLLALLS